MNKPIAALKKICFWIALTTAAALIFTISVNYNVEHKTESRIYNATDAVPHNKVALLLGTSPLNRYGNPNNYFTNRINTAAALFHAGKVDYILASGDNHTRQYDEPTAMRDSLIAHGVPADRVILDYAGFRTLDSVVRAKDVFGCDSLTIISQADHCARALYLAQSAGIHAVAIAAPLRAGRAVRIRLALREWLARDKMILDLWTGKKPRFLGEKIEIPDITPNPMTSYSTRDGVSLTVIEPDSLRIPVDSIIIEFVNDTDKEILFGEDYLIERDNAGTWTKIRVNPEYIGSDIITHAIGYRLAPHSSCRHTDKTRVYSKAFSPGKYRLSKSFIVEPWSENGSDTARVEFQVTQKPHAPL